LGNQLIAAFHAEDSIFRKFGAAVRTTSLKFHPAFHTEQRFEGIIGLALWAFHFYALQIGTANGLNEKLDWIWICLRLYP
jgi:hypothetical protein